MFDLQPGFNAMRGAVLTGHLSSSDERLLLNCFGPEYMRTATSLLSLILLRVGRGADRCQRDGDAREKAAT